MGRGIICRLAEVKQRVKDKRVQDRKTEDLCGCGAHVVGTFHSPFLVIFYLENRGLVHK